MDTKHDEMTAADYAEPATAHIETPARQQQRGLRSSYPVSRGPTATIGRYHGERLCQEGRGL
jgi:hypothetical protein